MRYTLPQKERDYRASMFSLGAIALLLALENLDEFCTYFVREAKVYNKVDDDYILDKEKMKASMEEAIDFISDGAGLK